MSSRAFPPGAGTEVGGREAEACRSSSFVGEMPQLLEEVGKEGRRSTGVESRRAAAAQEMGGWGAAAETKQGPIG